MHPDDDADRLVASLLRGDPWLGSEADTEHLVARAQVHGVLALLHTKQGPAWPPAMRNACRTAALGAAAWEMRHQAVLARTLKILRSHEVKTLVLKGSALAYSLYPDPSYRSRGDTDLLFRSADRSRAHEGLTQAGFLRAPAAPSSESNYTLVADDGSVHTIDAHWRLNNSAIVAACLDDESLWQASTALPRLSPHARGLAPVHALAYAGLHRLTHLINPYYVDGRAYLEPNRLIWLYDVRLLTESFGEDDWADLVALAAQRQLRTVCLDTLRAARDAVGSALPASVEAAIARVDGPERIWVYFHAGAIRRQWMDFRAAASLRDRLRHVWHLVFPPATYMMSRYPDARPYDLPYLYGRRVVQGLAKALRR